MKLKRALKREEEDAAHVDRDVDECVLAHNKQCCPLAGVQARVGLVDAEDVEMRG